MPCFLKANYDTFPTTILHKEVFEIFTLKIPKLLFWRHYMPANIYRTTYISLKSMTCTSNKSSDDIWITVQVSFMFSFEKMDKFQKNHFLFAKDSRILFQQFMIRIGKLKIQQRKENGIFCWTSFDFFLSVIWKLWCTTKIFWSLLSN